MAATPWRSPGRCRTSTASSPARSSGAASDVGWVVGHCYIVYGPLIHGSHHRALRGQAGRHARRRRLLARHRGARRARCSPRRPPSAPSSAKTPTASSSTQVRPLAASARSSSPASAAIRRPSHWAAGQLLSVPVIDHWWQTETGWPICGQLSWARASAGQARLARPSRCRAGTSQCSTTHGQPADSRARSARSWPSCRCRRARCRPCGTPTQRFLEAYLSEYPGYYKTGDAGFIDEDGYVSVMTRTDDVINVAGHRLSTGAIEEVLAAHPDVAECAVDRRRRRAQGPGAARLPGAEGGRRRGRPRRSPREVVQLVRERIGPVASFKSAVVVPRLPKTRSGKILRGTMQKIADGAAVQDAGHHRRPGDARRDHRRPQHRRLCGERLNRRSVATSGRWRRTPS